MSLIAGTVVKLDVLREVSPYGYFLGAGGSGCYAALYGAGWQQAQAGR